MEPTPSATLTVSYTIVLTPEPNLTSEQKEEVSKQHVIDQVAALARDFDWGIQVHGTVSSDLTETVSMDHETPIYEEQ